MTAEALLRAAGREPEAGDHLVEDEHRAVPAARGARAFEIAGRGMDRAGIAHRRFHDHAGDVSLGEAPLEPLEIVPAEHLDAVGRLRVLAGAAGDRDRAFLRPRRVEAGRRRPQDVVEPAVVMALELQDDAPARRGAGEADRRLHHLGTRGAEADALGAGHDLADEPRRLRLDFALPGEENAPIDLPVDRGADRRRAVPEDHRAHAEVIVDQPVAVGVEEIGAFPALEDEGRRRDAEAEIAVDAAGRS